jgi:hypothetical protein
VVFALQRHALVPYLLSQIRSDSVRNFCPTVLAQMPQDFLFLRHLDDGMGEYPILARTTMKNIDGTPYRAR